MLLYCQASWKICAILHFCHRAYFRAGFGSARQRPRAHAAASGSSDSPCPLPIAAGAQMKRHFSCLARVLSPDHLHYISPAEDSTGGLLTCSTRFPTISFPVFRSSPKFYRLHSHNIHDMLRQCYWLICDQIHNFRFCSILHLDNLFL
jgi:hypothetical protein